MIQKALHDPSGAVTLQPSAPNNQGGKTMSKTQGGLFLLAVLLAPMPVCADAPELRVAQSIVIDAPSEKVWEVVGDFAGISRWLPPIPESRLILGKNRQQGAIRELTRINGTKVQEKLLDYDPYNMTLSYTYIGGQPLVSDYLATISVAEAAEGKSRVEWKASFRRLDYWTDVPPPGQEDETLLKAFNRTYTTGLENLKKVIENP
jgi:uncharacterized protein YndB with AHSA1/START domain